ncbi:MAG TPA: iron uptake transporter permease EfeU [Actinophytocola sp.]|uniref:iron uptake transporter permease EfeU n=1 Tax=Actinophytocola sp. TaxID=1872138 RepID=UPI002DDD6A3D|nr:iron uptake transporter permease EfeU [Actinophytocola sp.]HEV2781366.1 iron uptake transporter permease EfeU [Actinophytocola sp.]
MLLSSALIGLREGLEAALVVSILVAFLVKTDRRASLPWVWTGVAAALAMSVGAGTVITYTSAQMSFEQQEIFGGTMSIIAVAFVTWMIFWMRATARTIAAELRGKLSKALRLGPFAVVVMAFLAVGREGLETTVLFYANVETAERGTAVPLAGFVLGVVAAVVLGWLIYRGAIRFNLNRFFTITGVLLIFVAAGILGYGLHDLQEGRVLPGLTTLAFDLSGPMPEDSWYGALLKGFFNYSAQTTVLQAIAWVLYVGIVLTLFLWPRRRPAAAPAPSPEPVTVKENS